jgi:prepilin-type N-terminal cleavage/methylation domain-containing protein
MQLKSFRRRRKTTRGSATAVGNSRRGFTIVELLVAVILLAIGLLGLAGTSGVVLRQMTRGNAQSMGSQVAASRFEMLAGRLCNATPTSGTATSRGVTESWSVTTAANETAIATVSVTMTGRKNAEAFSTVISCF